MAYVETHKGESMNEFDKLDRALEERERARGHTVAQRTNPLLPVFAICAVITLVSMMLKACLE